MNYTIVFESGRYRVYRDDLTTARGKFHTREQAQAWIDAQQKRGHNPQGKAAAYGTPELRSHYYGENERLIREVEEQQVRSIMNQHLRNAIDKQGRAE